MTIRYSIYYHLQHNRSCNTTTAIIIIIIIIIIITCTLIEVATPADRNVLRKEAENKLK